MSVFSHRRFRTPRVSVPGRYSFPPRSEDCQYRPEIWLFQCEQFGLCGHVESATTPCSVSMEAPYTRVRGHANETRSAWDRPLTHRLAWKCLAHDGQVGMNAKCPRKIVRRRRPQIASVTTTRNPGRSARYAKSSARIAISTRLPLPKRRFRRCIFSQFRMTYARCGPSSEYPRALPRLFRAVSPHDTRRAPVMLDI